MILLKISINNITQAVAPASALAPGIGIAAIPAHKAIIKILLDEAIEDIDATYDNKTYSVIPNGIWGRGLYKNGSQVFECNVLYKSGNNFSCFYNY